MSAQGTQDLQQRQEFGMRQGAASCMEANEIAKKLMQHVADRG